MSFRTVDEFQSNGCKYFFFFLCVNGRGRLNFEGSPQKADIYLLWTVQTPMASSIQNPHSLVEFQSIRPFPFASQFHELK